MQKAIYFRRISPREPMHEQDIKVKGESKCLYDSYRIIEQRNSVQAEIKVQSNIILMQPYEHPIDETPRPSFLAVRTPQIIQSSPFQPSRGRFASFNSTFMSPMQLNRSPELSCSQLNDLDNMVELELDKQVPTSTIESNKDYDCSSDSRDESQSEGESEGLFDIKSIIETVVNYIGINDSEIEKRRAQLKQARESKLLEVFEMLVRRLKKVKKTKEEMVKYCMRKVFRHIGSKNKKSNGRDVSQALREYFGSEKGFDVPFKRNSSDKTMNAAFLTKVFSCPIFVADYRGYIKNLQHQAQKDNSKKIKALARAIEKLGTIGTPKQLESLRRLPWTQVIINKVVDLSQNLLTYAGEQQKQTKQQTVDYKKPQEYLMEPIERYIPKKMSVIILTPPMGPIQSVIKEEIPELD